MNLFYTLFSCKFAFKVILLKNRKKECEIAFLSEAMMVLHSLTLGSL